MAVTVDPGSAQTLNIAWQGCAEAGLCYPPQHARIDVADYIATGSSPLTTGGTSEPLANDQSLAAQLANTSTGWVLLVFFGLGLILVFTLCVLPMLPILAGLIVGNGARGTRGFALSLAYVLPMAMVYVELGIVTALAGANLQVWLQTPWALGAFAAVFVALALSMFGVYELQLPTPIRDRLQRASQSQHGGSLGGAAVMGALSALIVGPCMTAPLAGALLYIVNSGNAVFGGAALFALGLGMGTPLVTAGSVGAHLLPRPGPLDDRDQDRIRLRAAGHGPWFVSRVVPAHWSLAGTGALTLAIAVTLYQLAMRFESPLQPAAMIARVAGLLVGLWGGLLIVGGAAENNSSSKPLAFAAISANAPSVAVRTPNAAGADETFMRRFDNIDNPEALDRRIDRAASQGRWTLVDFYADWCVSCKVIETEVFGAPRVQQTLSNVQLLRPDVTDNNADDRALMRRFGVVGPPTILLIGPDGEERRGARIVGELDAAAFLDHWADAHTDNGAS